MPDKLSSFECWVDSDFAGNWKPQDAPHDSMMWASKIETITTLSTTEAEYVALSMSQREVIPLMGLLKEIKHKVLRYKLIPQAFIAKFLKTTVELWSWPGCPRSDLETKHINQSYLLFHEAVERYEVSIVMPHMIP